MTTRKHDMGCKDCSSEFWECLSCGTTIPTGLFNRKKFSLVAMYCDCCEHCFVCKKCYTLTPEFDIWDDQFGSDHCMVSLVEEPIVFDSSLISRLLEEMLFREEFF